MGVLHTSSYYAKEYINPVIDVRSQEGQEAALSFLKGEEEKLYSAFGTNSYESFINKVKGLFTNENIAVLKKFTPAALKNSLASFQGINGSLYQEEVHFTFDLSKIDPIKFNIDKLKNSSFIISANGDEIELGFTYEHGSVKEVFNSLYRHNHFIPKSEDMSTVGRRLEELMNKDKILTVTTKDPSTGLFTEEYSATPIPNFPWGCTKKVYDEAVKAGRADVIADFQRAGQRIKNYICKDLCAEASPDLQRAVERTWLENFPAVDRDPALFFQGSTTSNFISGVQGSLGEFQAAVIFTFLEQSQINSEGYATILGDKLKRGEQLKTDVSIIENLGLQVKNMNTITNSSGNLQLIRDLETNIHPDKLAFYMTDGENFLDYIANYYFNTTYAEESQETYDSLIKVLGTYLGELMNFAMGEAIDTICFYFVGGKYLIPASRILESSKELHLEDSIEITSSYRGLPDLGYELPGHVGKNGKPEPIFVEYWKHPYSDTSSWIPTEKNLGLYNTLVTKLISIRTHFNLMSEIEKYALF